LEIVPQHADQVACFEGLVREIYVTMIPGCECREVIQALGTIAEKGFTPVPHMAARNFRSEADLESFFEGLKRNGIQKALIIAGGMSTPLGPYASTMEILKSPLFRYSGLKSVGLAGHPEGNSADKNSHKHLLEKVAFILEMGLGTEIVTQWSFSPEKVRAYIDKIREWGMDAPVLAGIAGPATLKTLLKYARICGVTAAKEVIRKQGFNFGRLLMSNDPGRFIAHLGGTDHYHLYPFGGLEKSARWLREQAHASIIRGDLLVDEAIPRG